jgi:hypothetical protein
MLLLKRQLIRLQEVRVLGVGDWKGECFYNFEEGLIAFIRKEVEEYLFEKALLDTGFVSLGIFVDFLDFFSEVFEFIIILLVQLVFEYFAEDLNFNRFSAVKLDGLDETKRPL